MDPLISTKLRPVRSRPRLVPRPRLSQRLDPEPGRRLTLVSAPAGFGKTTLLGEWWERRQGSERRTAWFSLDEGDNDPARFLGYLVAAVATVVDAPGFGEGVLATVRSPDPPRTDALLGALVNEIADLPRGLDLVLDDYHTIDSAAVHNLLSRLLDRLPDDAHIVLSGRVTPPLPLARLRARGQLVELGAADLAFTRDEAETFLRDVMGFDASAEDVATLKRRTEGWIAGLQLAALSLRGRADASTRVTAFAGTHRDVLDFVAEEVLDRQPPNVREFLLATSVLDPLTGPLCDALTGRSDGQQMLERLDRENLFVVALDEERRWYRYHHLFREFLLDRLRREHPERPAALHLKASAWSERNGRLAFAIEHALAAADHELAARLIERAVEGAVERGEGATALRWLEALPTEAKRRYPRLFVQHAVALVITGRPDADLLLDEAELAAGDDGEDSRFLLGFASAVRSWHARLRGDAIEAADLARRALSLLPQEAASVRDYAAMRLGDALRAVGDLEAARESYAEAVEIGHTGRHTYGRLAAMVMHARVCAEQGRLREADDAFRRALRLLGEEGFALSPAAGIIHIGMADLRYERDDLEGAERELEKGVELAERSGDISTLVWAYVTASRIRWVRGDEGGAFERACRAERVARDSGADLQIAIAVAWLARLHLARGDLSAAAAIEQERAAHADSAAVAAQAVDRVTAARVLHAQGWYDRALRLLEAPSEAAAATGRTHDLIEILTLRALALWAANNRVRAVDVLADAVAMAAPEGYIRIFVDEGQPLPALLSAMLDASQRGELGAPSRVPTQYVKKLLATLEREAKGAKSSAMGLPEPLTEREFDVLRLIAAGKSNRRIASELFVSVGTVKTHTNNLYRKLNVHSRTQALASARELNLL